MISLLFLSRSTSLIFTFFKIVPTNPFLYVFCDFFSRDTNVVSDNP